MVRVEWSLLLNIGEPTNVHGASEGFSPANTLKAYSIVVVAPLSQEVELSQPFFSRAYYFNW